MSETRGAVILAEHTAAGVPAIVLVDKPGGVTSHDVVARVRRAAGTRRVGHAGTLDPMATGLLILGVNSATRLLGHLLGLDKVYTATILLGRASSTDDAEGELGEPADGARLDAIDEVVVLERIAALTGEISQVPSSVSAIKVDGRRAYDLVREGATVALASRTVTVYDFALLALRRSAEGIELDVRVHCSSGTYIRALARDLGAGLGVGGHLTALRRTSIGPFSVDRAASSEEPLGGPGGGPLSPAEAATAILPSVVLDAQQAVDLGHGKKLTTLVLGTEPVPVVAALDAQGVLLGLLSWDGARARALAVFPPPPGGGRA